MVAVRKNLDLVWVWFYKEVAPTALRSPVKIAQPFKAGLKCQNNLVPQGRQTIFFRPDGTCDGSEP
jgi:hypothetical protein